MITKFLNINNKMYTIHTIACILICVVVCPRNGYTATENAEGANVFDTYQAIIKEGYPAETHRVTTHDGYILEVVRIPHGKNQIRSASRPVVFMMHGLLSAANSFVVLGSQYSIGYHLVDAGFDVWMGNARGNYFSRYHVNLDPDHAEQKFQFFDFSFEEIGMYDVGSMIDYVLEQTKQDKLHYIGHSQGGTAFLVLSTMRPEYNKKIKAAHLLAAVGYQQYFPNTQLVALAKNVDVIYNLALLIGMVEYFPTNITQQSTRSPDPDYCFGDMTYKNMCNLVGAREIMSENPPPVNVIAGAAIKQIAHYGQNIRDKIFRRWNYGRNKNIEVYGTSDPPEYDLKLTSTYVTMHYSLSDNLLDERDAVAMAEDIPKCKLHKVTRDTFLHEEYVTGIDAKELVTNYIIEDILKLEAGNYTDWGDMPEIVEVDTDEDNNGDSSSHRVACSTIIYVFLIFNSFYLLVK